MKDNAPTKRQQDVLDFIRDYYNENLCSPTVREIASGLGLSNHKGIRQHLSLLEAKGYLEIRHGIPRGIAVIPQGNEVPLYGKVAAGLPLDITANVDRMVTIPDGLFRIKPDFLLEISGDSMIDIGIYEGDLAAIKRVRSAHSGQVVVAMVNTDEMSREERKECGLNNTGITLKRLAVSGNRLLLKSENREKNYAHLVVRPERVSIEGRFVGLVRGG